MEEGITDENEDLSCIHWGYLNVMLLNDVAGKKVKRYLWETFWADLCGSTLRLYKDISLPASKHNFPPATMVGPRPEDQIKHAFFKLKNGQVKDLDAFEYFQKSARKNKASSLSRKNTLQIILADSSVYFLQAPTMSALYRWHTKIQSSIDSADSPEKYYDKQLRDAKMARYEQRRCYVPPEATYPEAQQENIEEEEEFPVREQRPCDPHVLEIKEKLLEKRRLLRQLERQEKDFLGADKDEQATITRLEFEATATKNYFLVPGRRETMIEAGKTFSVYGRLPNGRWRCFVDREKQGGNASQEPGKPECLHEGCYESINAKKDHAGVIVYPLIGSVPSSLIVELCQPSHIKDMVDNMSVSSGETVSDTSPPGTPPQETPVLPESHHKPAPESVAVSQSYNKSNQSRSLTRPTKLPCGNLDQVSYRVTRPSDSSPITPTSPASLPDTPTQTIASAISDLNLALESLSLLKPRSRLSSEVSTCSRASTSSQEDDVSDMSRGSRLESDDDASSSAWDTGGVVRRRKRRDIHISRKLHEKGISLVVGSSSSSEDEEDAEQGKNDTNIKQIQPGKSSSSRKIEELHTSKEKLTEKALQAPKPFKETTTKAPNGDRGSLLDKPTTTNELLREFSENGCYGLPVRNSMTQAQFKPLASHEIPPPLHQRRTLQMTRKENEGFGFVLQTHTIVQTGAYSDSMTFVSNVSEDGPAYLAGMRPGDVIIEIENATVEDDDQQMIAETLRNAGCTVRLVVIYKDAIHRMRLSTRLMALKARLQEAETAYDALEEKEKMVKGRVKDPSTIDVKVRIALIYIHIQIASSTFARDSPLVKNTVVQNKKTPTELLQVKQPPMMSDVSRMCGVPTTGFDLVREFASSCDTDAFEKQQRTTSPKYASDTALNTAGKKRKISEGSAKQKTFKQRQRSSFISYVDFEEENVNERRRVKSDGYEHEDEFRTSESFVGKAEKPSGRKTLTTQASVVRPESYMFAVSSQNALNTNPLKGSSSARLAEYSMDEGFV